MELEKVIGVDAYGGDEIDEILPEERIAIATAATAEKHPDFTFFIIGNNYEILTKYCDMPDNVKIHQVIPEKRFGVLRELTRMVNEGTIGGFYTLANTQLILPVVDNYIGTIEELTNVFNGKARPPLLAEIPKSPCVSRVKSWYLLDVGAIPQLTKPEQYLLYAKIGSLYAELVGERPRPYVGLANIGSESGKGTDLQREAFRLLQNSGLNFIGNVEPYCRTHDYDKGKSDNPRPVDVVVQDGTGGNEYIKVFPEGAGMTSDLLKEEIKNGRWYEKLGALLMRKAFQRIKKKISPGQYGGAPFLGLNAPVFKGHGTTGENGIIVGLEKYIRFVEKKVIQRMKEELAKPVVYAAENGVRSRA